MSQVGVRLMGPPGRRGLASSESTVHVGSTALMKARTQFEEAEQQLCSPNPPNRAVWYKIGRKELRPLGNGLLSIVIHRYQGSLSRAVTELFPDHAWEPWRFRRIPPNYWDNVENRIKFFDSYAAENNINNWPEDWYDVAHESIRLAGGCALLRNYYQDSLVSALESLYPHIEWQPWRFPKAPSNFWVDPSNQRRFWDALGKRLKIKSFEEWYDVPGDAIRDFGGVTLVRNFFGGSIHRALAAAYPEHQWDKWKFVSSLTY